MYIEEEKPVDCADQKLIEDWRRNEVNVIPEDKLAPVNKTTNLLFKE